MFEIIKLVWQSFWEALKKERALQSRETPAQTHARIYENAVAQYAFWQGQIGKQSFAEAQMKRSLSIARYNAEWLVEHGYLVPVTDPMLFTGSLVSRKVVEGSVVYGNGDPQAR